MKCDCMDRANAKIQERYPGVFLSHFVDVATGRATRLQVAAERLVGKGKVPPIAAEYCPFCGQKYEDK